MKKASIFNPYLDTLGGGERYTMAVATTLAKNGYEVDIEWKNPSIKQDLENRFGINLKDINFISDIKRGDGYDLCFWVGDGSIPTLHARKNFLHFQIPFQNVKGKSLLNKMKLFRVHKVICNSEFTKKIVDKEYGFSDKSIVIYPPVDIKKFRPKKQKENIILYVGRFSRLTQSKRQDVLIKVFKKLYKQKKNWKLILAGGTEVGADEYFEQLKSDAKSFPIEILESPKFDKISDLFARAKIFWSASGYGVDENTSPQKVEHFGITVVEAMSAGVVPIVFSAGGHKEIINNGINGFLWTKKNTLINKTIALIDDSKILRNISDTAKKDSNKYGYERFEKEFLSLL